MLLGGIRALCHILNIFIERSVKLLYSLFANLMCQFKCSYFGSYSELEIIILYKVPQYLQKCFENSDKNSVLNLRATYNFNKCIKFDEIFKALNFCFKYLH